MPVGTRGPYRKTRLRQQQIVDDAMALIAQRGVADTTLRDVASAVGVSQTALLHHFRTKDGLLLAVLKRREEVDLELYTDMFVQEGVIPTIAHSLHFSTDRAGLPALFAMLAGDASRPVSFMHEFFVSRYETVTRRLEAYLHNDVALGRVRAEIDVTRASRRLIALSDGLQLQWLLNPTTEVVPIFLSSTADLLPPAVQS